MIELELTPPVAVIRIKSEGKLNILDEKLMKDMIAKKSPLVIKKIKECVYDKPDFILERKNFSLCFSTEDQREGMRAFLEKRKPEFKGR